MHKEWLARLVLSLGITFAVGIPAVGWLQHTHTTVLHARMAENGGWTPENLTAQVGQPLHLKLTSDDVLHGFAVGQLDQPAVDVKPGEMTEVTLVFDKPGKYTFYCTHWCSVNHWRMRGTIEVTGDQTKPEPNKPPLYILLGLDIDANHQASAIPAQMPSAWRGALLMRVIPDTYKNHEYYLSHTPLDLWLALNSEPSLTDLDNQQLWDLVAWVWQSNTSQEQVQEGKQLFTANCAACHGEGGAGNGVFAGQLTENLTNAGSNRAIQKQVQPPANFTDASRMLSASPAHLQGKIIRGGMGTGMPYWGPIFTEDQTWSLIAYLWTFQFQLEVAP